MKSLVVKNIFSVIVLFFIADVASAQLYIGPDAIFKLSGNAQVTLHNINLVNDGIISVPANGRFIFNGANDNILSGSVAPSFSELEIAKTASGSLTLQQNINIKNKIIFTSNLIDLNDHNIDLGTTGFLEGEKETSRITGLTGGEVLIATTLNAPSGINPGNMGAVITSSQNLGFTIIHRGHKSQTTSAGGGSSINRYFEITPTNNIGLNATLRINYFDAEKNLLEENILEMWRSNDQLTWISMGYSGRDAFGNYVEKTGLNDFSSWTLSPGGALPVTGLQLTGNWKNNAAHLTWITFTEYHNSHFTIERKYSDDLNFMAIGRKNSAHPDGNSQSATKYNWADYADNNNGSVEYRLQQQDMEGRTAFSNIIVIKPEPSSAFILSMYPTISVKNQVYIKTGSRNVGQMQVSIYDMKGRLLISKKLNYQSQWLDLPQMSAGSYKMFIRSGDYRWEGSFVKE